MAIDNLDNELGKLRIQKSRKGKSRGGGGKLFLSILLIAGAAVAGYFYYSKVTAAIPVKVIRVQSETASGSGGDASGAAALIAGGYVIPRNKIEVSSKIVGVVKDIRVEQG
ncbi:hypothetical protein HY256_10560, partial [Candidatus Sumerlaeota bacterium]|nr:hypothetical protein [Candidatus Sumerlaeota bacterium]